MKNTFCVLACFFITIFYLCAQFLQDLQDEGHITDLGDILDTAHAVHHQSGGEDGYSGIFGAADLDLAVEVVAAFDLILGQNYTLFNNMGCLFPTPALGPPLHIGEHAQTAHAYTV